MIRLTRMYIVNSASVQGTINVILNRHAREETTSVSPTTHEGENWANISEILARK
jgi:hypothetical protein